MAMKVNALLTAPTPDKAAPDENLEDVMALTYCVQPSLLSKGDTTTEGSELKVPGLKVTVTWYWLAIAAVNPVPEVITAFSVTVTRMMRRFSSATGTGLLLSNRVRVVALEPIVTLPVALSVPAARFTPLAIFSVVTAESAMPAVPTVPKPTLVPARRIT